MGTKLRAGRTLLFVPLVMAMGGCDDSDPVTPPANETVVDVALEVNRTSGEFSTLMAALDAADLVETLQGTGPFTVFAPTDAAFAALDLNADNIGDQPVATLRNILLYHVAPGRLTAADVTSRSSLTMANGTAASIAVSEGAARIDGARIVQTDIAADNGVIHVVDAVLLP